MATLTRPYKPLTYEQAQSAIRGTQAQQPGADDQGRTWGQTASDTGIALTRGATNLAGSLASVADMATGGILDTGVVKPVQQALDRALGGEGRAPGIAGAYEQANTQLSQRESPTLQRSKRELDEAEGVTGKVGKLMTDPALLASMATEQVPNLVTLGAGAAGTAAAKGTQLLGQGLTRSAASAGAKKAVERQIIASTAAQGGGAAGQAAEQEALAMGATPEQAKNAGMIAAGTAAPIAALAGKITAPLEAGIFTRSLAPGLLSRQGMAQVVRGTGKEFAEEAIQEGGEQFAQNLGIQQTVDPTRGLMQGVPESAAIGGVLGGVIGGPLTAGGVVAGRGADAAAPEAPPNTVQQFEQAMQGREQPAAQPDPLGITGTTADFTVGPDGVARPMRPDAEFGAAPPATAAPSVPFPDAAPGSLSDAANAIAASDVVAQTSEAINVRPPEPVATDNESIIESILGQFRAGNMIDSELVASSFKIDKKQAAELRREARARLLAEREAQTAGGQPQAAEAIAPTGDTTDENGALPGGVTTSTNTADAPLPAAPGATQETTDVRQGTQGQEGQNLSAEGRGQEEVTAEPSRARAREELFPRIETTVLPGGDRIVRGDPNRIREVVARSGSKNMGQLVRENGQIVGVRFSEGAFRRAEPAIADENARIEQAAASMPAANEPIPAVMPEPAAVIPEAEGLPLPQPEPVAAAAPVSAQNIVQPPEAPEPEAAPAAPVATQPAQAEEPAEIQDDDITTPSGQPFTVRDAAELAARREGPSARVVPVDGGFVVRTTPAPVVPEASQVEQKEPQFKPGQKVKASGATYEFVKENDDGTLTLKADNGSEFDTEQGEVVEPVADSQDSGRVPINIPRDEYIKRNLEESRARSLEKLNAARDAIEKHMAGVSVPVGVSRVAKLIEKPRRSQTKVERQLIADLRIAERNLSADTIADADMHGRVWDRLNQNRSTQDQERRTDTESRAKVDALPVDERDAEIARLREEVRRDELTGLLNQKAYKQDEAAGAFKPHMAMIDLDLFKGLNDILGYDGADQVLKVFGRIIAKVNPDGQNYRRGGDEFTMTADTAEALQTAVRRLNNLAMRVSIELTAASGERMIVQGIGHSTGVGTDASTANAALKRAKSGKPSSREGAVPTNVRPAREAGRPAPAAVPAAEPDRQGPGSGRPDETAEVVEALPVEEAATAPAAEPVPEPAPVTATTETDANDPSTLDGQIEVLSRLADGSLSLAEYRAGFAALRANREKIIGDLGKLTKEKLLRMNGRSARMVDPKSRLVSGAYSELLTDYNLESSFSWSMGEKLEDVMQRRVDAVTEQDLKDYAAKVAEARAKRAERAEQVAEAVVDPKTYEEFSIYLNAKRAQGMTFNDARMTLSPEKREMLDRMMAESSRSKRRAKKVEKTTEVRAAGQLVDGKIIETKHTKHGHDLFVVQLAERVSREDYDTLNASAKKLGGGYSSFRGRGAVPGFQFRTREAAEAFSALAGGDTAAAQEAAKARRDAFQDDRSQSAVERLREMADRLDERANASMAQERKANTERRARFAASADAQARADKALAQTMRNIADAIEAGRADMLDQVRAKTQIEFLRDALRSAKDQQLRAKYSRYSDYERLRDEPPDAETVDYATFPSYSLYRSDWATLGRQLLNIDGTKMLGQKILKLADDVTDAYVKFAKIPTNFIQLSTFSTRDGKQPKFTSLSDAEYAIKRSGFRGKAIPLKVKRGEYAIIASPSVAKERGIWGGDPDQRIAVNAEFGAEIVEKIGKANRKRIRLDKISLPWAIELAHDRLSMLSRMGIETAAEFRTALREFQALREAPQAEDRIKKLERAMVGRKNDGLDFFPTSRAVVDEMLAAAEIEQGMSVLEPSAGMGHIADAIRDQGVDPVVGEISGERRELLEAKGYEIVGDDFLKMEGANYDRIVMNPPFSNRRDAEHVRHAYGLLKPGGRVVAIMGEGVFFGQDKKAQEFREWLESVDGTSETLPDGSFMDPSLPVNTAVRARMVVIDKPGESGPQFSKGQPSDQARTPEFRRWFGDSKVVDANGEPLVVYHGTEKSGFDAFDPDRAGESTGRDFPGIYFTNHKLGAETYSGTKREAEPREDFDQDEARPGNYPVYLSIKNPAEIDFEGQGWDAEVDGFFGMDEFVRYAQENGFDGVIARNVNDEGSYGQGYGWGDVTYVVFRPEQIKSATGNRGTFDPNDPSILRSRDNERAAIASPARLTAEVKRITAKWAAGSPGVEVLSDHASAPDFLRNAPGFDEQVNAAIYRGTIYLFANRMGTVEKLRQTLAHEAVGHFSMETMLGPEMFEWLVGKLNAARGDAALAGLFAEIDNRYGRNLDPGTFAREAIAVMAERGIKPGWVDRVFGAIRAFLRRMGFDLQLSRGDLIRLLHQAGRYIEGAADARAQAMAQFGRWQTDGGDQQQAEAFSMGDGATVAPTDDGIDVADEPVIDDAFVAGLTDSEMENPAVVSLASQLYDAYGVFSPFVQRWLGKSKAVTDTGATGMRVPITLYHGTNRANLQAFDRRFLGGTNAAASGLGFFVTPEKSVAEQYGENVLTLYARIENPYEMTTAEFDTFRTANDAQIRAEELRAEGFDGVYLPDQDFWVAFEPNQFKAADQRGTFDRTAGLFRSKQAGTFYSALAQSIESGKGAPKKAEPGAWGQWLDGAQRRGEFRQSERDWMGLDAWLEQQNGPVTREALADFVRSNEVRVQEVVLGGPSGAQKLSRQTEIATSMESDHGIAIYDDTEGGFYLQRMDSGERVERDSLSDEAESLLSEWESLNAETGGGAKFGDPKYRLPGGQNYRELLLTLPEDQGMAMTDEQRRNAMNDFKRAMLDKYGINWRQKATEAELAENSHLSRESVAALISRASATYSSSHWDQKNVFAHVRFDERTDADGKRVLFINEVQSDWHQEGRRKGYGKSTVPAGWAETGSIGGNKVPDAPLKATDEWAMAAFKRMARWAVDNGFDRVGWVTGEQAADFFDLSKQISRVHFDDNRSGGIGSPRMEGPPSAGMLSAFDISGKEVFSHSVEPDQVADYVGKDVAEKLLNADPREARYAGLGVRRRELSGVDLKVGGEGMRGFYDKILPAAVGKWAKKFGARVGETRLTAGEKSLANFASYADFKAAKNPEVTAHSIDITPAMREAVAAGQPLFSRDAASVFADIEKAAKPVPDGFVRKLADWFSGMSGRALRENLRPAWLGALTLRHLAEIGTQYLPEVGRYADVVQAMATDRNVMQEAAGKRADEWERWARQNRAAADALAGLMHDSTLDGVDPTEAYQRLTLKHAKLPTEVAPLGVMEITPRNADDASRLIRKRMRGAPDAQKKADGALLAMIEEKLSQERRRAAAYPGLVQRYNAMPEKARELYVSVRDDYRKQVQAVEDALVERIMAMQGAKRDKAAMVATLRSEFEANRLQGPYFPLARFGDFWIAHEDAETGEPVYSMFETEAEWDRARKALKSAKVNVTGAGRKIDTARLADGVSSSFMGDLQEMLAESGTSKQIQDDVWQLYLRTMPSLSLRKRFIHRKGTAGYSNDALRAYAGNSFHASFQIARLKHTHKLENLLSEMEKRNKEQSKDIDSDDAIKSASMINEMKRRHEWVMNPRDSAVSNVASSVGFAWYLGVTPAAAVTNLTQTAVIAFPVLAAKFGAGRSMNQLLRAFKQAAGSVRGDIKRTLTNEQERQAFAAWEAAGYVDKTLAHNLAGISETDTSSYSPLWRNSMNWIAMLFHKAEVLNRETTLLAAYRLAVADGMSHADAVRYAGEATMESHYDYSNANRARFMQSGAAKVLLMFKQYSLNTTWFLLRNAYLSMKGATPAERRLARRKLAGVLGMTGMFAGALGLPMMGTMFAIANAAHAAFDDEDDEPFDAETEFRNFLADMLGAEPARWITQGPIEGATGVEISSRTGLNELWFREPNRELEGRELATYWLEQAAGPVAGIGLNAFVGMDMVNDGQVLRGIEAMSPKAIKDGLRALRYSTDGVNTLRGDPIIEDLGLAETIMQLAGFSPARLNDRYDANASVKNFEGRLLKRRQALLDAYAMAVRLGDREELAEVSKRVAAWNQSQPELQIDRRTLNRSLAQRMRYSTRAESGIVVDRRIQREAMEQGRFAG